jgi:hypothetical protein
MRELASAGEASRQFNIRVDEVAEMPHHPRVDALMIARSGCSRDPRDGMTSKLDAIRARSASIAIATP